MFFYVFNKSFLVKSFYFGKVFVKILILSFGLNLVGLEGGKFCLFLVF